MSRPVVLLAAHGTPRSLDEIPAFLRAIRHGRETPPALVAEVRRRYEAIGGRSPLTEITRAQAEALARRLGVPVFCGMRAWHPLLRDVVEREVAPLRPTKIVVCALAPQFSNLSVGAYIRAVREGCEAAFGREALPSIVPVRRWAQRPALAEAFAEKVREALARHFPDDPDAVALVFTAHSLPTKILETSDPYPVDFEATARNVLDRVGGAGRTHRSCYQSQGMTAEPWLGPDLPTTLRDLRDAGARAVLVVPVGFVADHVEVLYDLDIEAREVARSLGLDFARTASLNDSPRFIDALEEAVRDRLEE